MAIAFVQATKVESSAGNSASATVAWTAGNALVCPASVFQSPSASIYPTVSGGGGTWTSDTSGGNASGPVGGSISSNPNPTGTGATITVTVASNGAGLTASVYEFSTGGTLTKDATSPA